MKYFQIIIILVFIINVTYSQIESNSKPDRNYKPLQLSLNDDNSKYLRFLIWNQFWATTNNISKNDLNEINFSLRRTRFLALAQISDRFLILTHFGLNNLSANNMDGLGNRGDGPQLFIHDAWGEFKINEYLYIGGGLHYWNGMTRLANQSTLNFMTLDAPRPFTHWFSLGITDQFARDIGVYFKGDIGKLEYRLAVNNPINPKNSLGVQHFGDIASNIQYNGSITPNSQGNKIGNMVFEGYLKYDLLEKESMKLPYYMGTYLGKKKILNLGFGFFSHPNGTYDTLNSVHENVLNFAGDVFFDHPINGGAINTYASIQFFDYGDNYMSRWAGSGITSYFQVGYFYKNWKLMPYISYQYSQFDGLKNDPSSINVGLNYFLNNHHAKITLEYMGIYNNILEGGTDQLTGNPNNFEQLRLQTHIFL